MKRMRAFFLALGLSLSMITPRAQADSSDNLIIGAAVAATAAGTYYTGKGLCWLLAWRAESRFNDELKIKETHKNSQTLWSTIKEQILRNHVNYYSYGEYRNFPCLRFKSDLDYYIWRLKVLRFLHMRSYSTRPLNTLIASLDDLRTIISENDYIKERREFEKNTGRQTA